MSIIVNEQLEDKNGKEMDMISFKEFIESSLGISFEEIYKNYLIHGANYDKQSHLE